MQQGSWPRVPGAAPAPCVAQVTKLAFPPVDLAREPVTGQRIAVSDVGSPGTEVSAAFEVRSDYVAVVRDGFPRQDCFYHLGCF